MARKGCSIVATPGAMEQVFRIPKRCEVNPVKRLAWWTWENGQTTIMSDYYGISGTEEAKAYLADPILGSRLFEICKSLMELDDKDASRIFGYPDVLKLRSCMTLFAAVSEEDSVFQQVLDAYYRGEKGEQTLRITGRIKR